MESEVAEKIVQQTFAEAVRVESIDIVAPPSVSISEGVAEGKPLHYTARVEVKPRLDPKDYRGLAVGRKAPHVPDDAVKAALAMQQAVHSLNDQQTSAGWPSMQIGIGLHTGDAVVGNIGSPQRLDYTAIGDTVNIASRLESLTKELGWTIIASEQVMLSAGPGVKTGRKWESIALLQQD